MQIHLFMTLLRADKQADTTSIRIPFVQLAVDYLLTLDLEVTGCGVIPNDDPDGSCRQLFETATISWLFHSFVSTFCIFILRTLFS
jgi:hypothetical protein